MDKDVIEKSLGCDLKKDLIDCPVPYGGVLLFTNLTVHRSVTNKSDGIRWSMDLRWQVMEPSRISAQLAPYAKNFLLESGPPKAEWPCRLGDRGSDAGHEDSLQDDRSRRLVRS